MGLGDPSKAVERRGHAAHHSSYSVTRVTMKGTTPPIPLTP